MQHIANFFLLAGGGGGLGGTAAASWFADYQIKTTCAASCCLQFLDWN